MVIFTAAAALAVNHIGRRTIICMLPIAVIGIVWNVLGGP
jgi:hypothetical protein